MTQKIISATLTPVTCANWSIMTIRSSASAASTHCWACLGQRSINDRLRCGNQRCGSWPGSTPCIWRIPAAAAAGWSTIWPEKGSRSAETESETSCAATVYGRSTRSHAPRCQAIHPSSFPAWWISGRSRPWIRSERQTSPTSSGKRAFSIWWRSWISIPDMCSVGRSPTALTRNSVWKPLRWPWKMGASHRSSTPIKTVSSRPPTLSPGCRGKESRSAGLAEGTATTTSSLNGYGGRSSRRKCTYVPSEMAGTLKSAWPAFYGGTAM